MTFSPVTFSSVTFATKKACKPLTIVITIKVEVCADGIVKVTAVT